MPDLNAFRDWGHESRPDAVRRRIVLAALAGGAVLAIFLVVNVDFWNRSHSEVLRLEREEIQDDGVAVGMFDHDVRASLGEPNEVEEAPFDPSGPNGAGGPFRACQRLLYRWGGSKSTTIYLDAQGRVLEVDHGLTFDAIEF